MTKAKEIQKRDLDVLKKEVEKTFKEFDGKFKNLDPQAIRIRSLYLQQEDVMISLFFVCLALFAGFLFNLTANIVYEKVSKSGNEVKTGIIVVSFLLLLALIYLIKRLYLDRLIKMTRSLKQYDELKMDYSNKKESIYKLIKRFETQNQPDEEKD